jgi:hypothetical protein
MPLLRVSRSVSSSRKKLLMLRFPIQDRVFRLRSLRPRLWLPGDLLREREFLMCPKRNQGKFPSRFWEKREKM